MFGLTAVECFVAIVAIFVVVYWITPHKHSWFPLVVITVLLAVLAYNMVPNSTDDLVRYYQELRYMRERGTDELDRAFRENLYEWNTYRVAAYYFYIVSRLHNNAWLQTITIFIVYGLMFLVIYKASKRFEINKLNMFLGTMFFISTYWFYDTASGIRNGLSFAVAFACAYYHLVERKNITLCYVGYILACLTHSAGIMPVVMVIIAELTLNTSGKFMNFILLFGIVGGGVFIQFLADRTDNNFVQSIAGKAETHGLGDSLETGTMFRVNLTVLLFVTLLFIYVAYYLLHSDYTNELKRLYKYFSINIYFMFGCVLSGLVFVRFARWTLPIIGALLFMIGMQIQSNQIEKEGRAKLTYFTPFNQSARIKTRSLVYILYVAYTGVHFWYLCNGSSLHWLHF